MKVTQGSLHFLTADKWGTGEGVIIQCLCAVSVQEGLQFGNRRKHEYPVLRISESDICKIHINTVLYSYLAGSE